MKDQMEKASVVLPRALFQKAKQVAAARKESFCSLVRRLILDHLDEYLGAAKGEPAPRG
jgi:hypothetical protein